MRTPSSWPKAPTSKYHLIGDWDGLNVIWGREARSVCSNHQNIHLLFWLQLCLVKYKLILTFCAGRPVANGWCWNQLLKHFERKLSWTDPSHPEVLPHHTVLTVSWVWKSLRSHQRRHFLRYIFTSHFFLKLRKEVDWERRLDKF